MTSTIIYASDVRLGDKVVSAITGEIITITGVEQAIGYRRVYGYYEGEIYNPHMIANHKDEYFYALERSK